MQVYLCFEVDHKKIHVFWKFKAVFPTEPSRERYVANSGQLLLQYRLLLNVNDQIKAKNSLKQQHILEFKKEALKVAAEQSPGTDTWFL